MSRYAGGAGAGKWMHVLVVERVLGKPLPHGSEVHHVDGNGKHNENRNLVLCEDHEYHMLLHRRQRALDACGHADWRKCYYCKTYDAVSNLVSYRKGFCHAECSKAHNQNRRNSEAFREKHKKYMREYNARTRK